MGIELLLPFFASVAITIGLRRLDKSNMKLSQIKRYADKLSEEIRETAVLQIQNIKDASIDIDLQLKQARKISEDIQSLAGQSKTLYEDIRSGRDYLSEVSKEMVSVLEFANSTKEESLKLEESLATIQNYRLDIAKIQEDMQSLRENVSEILDVFQEKLDLRSDEILQSLAQKLIELESLMEKKSDALDTALTDIAQSAREKLSQETSYLIQETVGRIDFFRKDMDMLIDSLQDAENRLDLKVSRFEDTSSILSEKVDRFEERLEEKATKAQNRTEEKIQNLEKRLTEKFDRILEQIFHSKETFLEGIRSEVGAIKQEIEGLSLETMTRRDEILNETRRQAENLNSRIQEFQEKYLEAENKLFRQADSRKAELMRQIEAFAEEFRNVSEELRSEADRIRGEALCELRSFNQEIDRSRKQAETRSEEAILKLRQELESKIRTDFSGMEEKLQSMSKEISLKTESIDAYVDDLRKALTESAREILEEAEKKAYSFEDILTNQIQLTEQKVEAMIGFWEEEIKKARERILTGSEGLEERIRKIHLDGDGLVQRLQEEYSEVRRKLDEYQRARESMLEEDCKTYQKELADRFTLLKKTAEDFFSRQELKVEKLNETIDNRISKQLAKLVDKGNLHLGQMEEKIQKHIASLKKDLDESFRGNREEFKNFKQEIQNGIEEALELKEEILSGVADSLHSIREEVEGLTAKIQYVRAELHSIEESRKVIEKSESVLRELSGLLEAFQSEESNIREIHESLKRAERLKAGLELEIQNLQEKWESASQMDGKINEISSTLDHLTQESLRLQKNWSEIQGWEEKLEKILDTQIRISKSLHEIEKTREALEHVRKVQEDQVLKAEDLTERILEMDRSIQIIESRERELAKSIQNADLRAKDLLEREREILGVEAKFEKIESLIGDLSERHKQALVLQKRVEELRKETSRSKEDLEELLAEADEKFEKLSAFLDLVQNSIPAEKGSVKASKPSPLLERKKATILTLHKKYNWSSEAISEKLGIEKSLVDTVLGLEKAK